VLNWLQQFSTFCFLDNHQYQIEPHSLECLAAAGKKRFISVPAGNALNEFERFYSEKSSWLFGHFAFDLKTETEGVLSSHPDRIKFPDLYFFEPEVIIRLNEKEIIIEATDPKAVYNAIEQVSITGKPYSPLSINVQQVLNRQEYIDVIHQLQQHILRGDCYEINFCQEFFATNAKIDPLIVYNKLGAVSPNPFSGLYRVDDKWVICASPERFLRKQGTQLISQPMKGTSKRYKGDATEDGKSRKALLDSAKDRSENVMVVDLVRNDLAKVCVDGTVKVDELYGVYSFPQVHQMISTVSGQVKAGVSLAEIIRATFPMGSMTGAPKKRVLELIEQYEKTKRGIFSGAMGYISPTNDFDFNVVIRSILYNASDQVLSFQAGSGITFYSDAEKEWEECLLKAEAIKNVLME
jgi:para-aminobenzoate synthetase component 1